MFLRKKFMFKDGSFFLTLVQSHYSSREIPLEVDGLRKICLCCLKVLILVQILF